MRVEAGAVWEAVKQRGGIFPLVLLLAERNVAAVLRRVDECFLARNTD